MEVEKLENDFQDFLGKSSCAPQLCLQVGETFWPSQYVFFSLLLIEYQFSLGHCTQLKYSPCKTNLHDDRYCWWNLNWVAGEGVEGLSFEAIVFLIKWKQFSWHIPCLSLSLLCLPGMQTISGGVAVILRRAKQKPHVHNGRIDKSKETGSLLITLGACTSLKLVHPDF